MKKKRIQFRVFAAKIVEHVFVRSTEIVDIGFPKRRSRKFDMRAGTVGRDFEALPLEKRVSFHASILVRRTHHCISELHASSKGAQNPQNALPGFNQKAFFHYYFSDEIGKPNHNHRPARRGL